MSRIAAMTILGAALGYLLARFVMMVLTLIFIPDARISLHQIPEWAWWVTEVVSVAIALAFGLYSLKGESRRQRRVVAPLHDALATRSNILQTALSWSVSLVFLVLVGWQFFPVAYRALVNLNGNHTVNDFQKSSASRRIDFLHDPCGHGTCQTWKDFQCGYEITWNYPDPIANCIRRLAALVPANTRLEKLVGICGRHFLEFDPIRIGITQDTCEKAGGQWAKKHVVWSDAEELLKAVGLPEVNVGEMIYFMGMYRELTGKGYAGPLNVDAIQAAIADAAAQ